jgi:hypothetical protein
MSENLMKVWMRCKKTKKNSSKTSEYLSSLGSPVESRSAVMADSSII